MVPEPLKLLSVPPVTATSLCVKSVLASLRVKVTMAVSPALSEVLLLVMAMVGTKVSVTMVTVLLVSAPSALRLPTASLKVLLATLTTQLPEKPGVGVKVAV